MANSKKPDIGFVVDNFNKPEPELIEEEEVIIQNGKPETVSQAAFKITEEPKPRQRKKKSALDPDEVRVPLIKKKAERKEKRVQLVMKQSLFDALKKETERNNISVNEFIGLLIENYLEGVK